MAHRAEIQQRNAYGCRVCGECRGMSHHWLDACPVDLSHTHCCKHCDAVGMECVECHGEGCEFCDLEGVVQIKGGAT